MNLSLMWRIMLFTWTNILVFIGLCYIVLEVFVKPFGFKEATPLLKNKLNKTPKQEEIYPLNSEEEYSEYLNSLKSNSIDADELSKVYTGGGSDGFLPSFNKRIKELKHELDEDENDGIPEDLKGAFFTYPEDEEYLPELFEQDSGVEIITDAYEKRIEDRLE